MYPIQKIEVLGPGCSRCKEVYSVIQRIVDETNLDVEVIKSDSIDRMVQLGTITASPAVVVDGHVAISGQVPKPAQVRKLLGLAK